MFEFSCSMTAAEGAPLLRISHRGDFCWDNMPHHTPGISCQAEQLLCFHTRYHGCGLQTLKPVGTSDSHYTHTQTYPPCIRELVKLLNHGHAENNDIRRFVFTCGDVSPTKSAFLWLQSSFRPLSHNSPKSGSLKILCGESIWAF